MCIVELIIKLMEVRGKNRRDVFIDYVKPLWEEIDKMHNQYVNNFNAYRAALIDTGLSRNLMHQLALNIDQYRSARQNIARHIQSLENSSSKKVDGINKYIDTLTRSITDYLNMERFVRLAAHGDSSPDCLIDHKLKKTWNELTQVHMSGQQKAEFQHLFVPVKLREGAVILRTNPYCLALQRNLLSMDRDEDAAIEFIDMIMAHLHAQYEILLDAFHDIKVILLK